MDETPTLCFPATRGPSIDDWRSQRSCDRLAASGHCGARFSGAVRLLGRGLGLSPLEVEELEDAASWHDVGKRALPAALLDKPGALSRDEWRQMTRHTLVGAELLQSAALEGRELPAQIALYHHERWDGSGYPYGLRGEEIPFPARLVAVVDSYDALCSWRPYRPPLSHREASGVLLRGDGRTRPEHFDPQLLGLFRDSSWELELNDGLARMEDGELLQASAC